MFDLSRTNFFILLFPSGYIEFFSFLAPCFFGIYFLRIRESRIILSSQLYIAAFRWEQSWRLGIDGQEAQSIFLMASNDLLTALTVTKGPHFL